MKRTPVKDSGPAVPAIPPLPQPPSLREFRKMVLDQYRNHGRDLAWRRTTDPYRILVSEIMLQQTQVERVAVKYPQFIAAFPDFPTLAIAPLAEVLAVWQGMGYNRRAVSLQKCARRVVEEHGGILPQDPEILATFPGIGRATAASICAFAFNMPVVFIETNIRRVFIHYYFCDQEQVDDAEILPLARQALAGQDPRTWYNALMDLGTVLKKTVQNPNRRSRQYTKQPAFEGSDRKIRGGILRLLLECPGQHIDELIRNTGEERERVLRIIGSLEKEGFVTSGDFPEIRTG
ncbi:MAG: A/G-specific adenine glycosylase [Methanoregula sp.]|nr:A/G-specific adenine glycosylase [Methanoregula sp.]